MSRLTVWNYPGWGLFLQLQIIIAILRQTQSLDLLDSLRWLGGRDRGEKLLLAASIGVAFQQLNAKRTAISSSLNNGLDIICIRWVAWAPERVRLGYNFEVRDYTIFLFLFQLQVREAS